MWIKQNKIQKSFENHNDNKKLDFMFLFEVLAQIILWHQFWYEFFNFSNINLNLMGFQS